MSGTAPFFRAGCSCGVWEGLDAGALHWGCEWCLVGRWMAWVCGLGGEMVRFAVWVWVDRRAW